MAQTINTNTNYGLFEAVASEFTTITESGSIASLSADLSECKDPVTVIVDIPAGITGNFVFTCIRAGSGEGIDVPLTAGKPNVFRITSYGLKKEDGSADFALTGSDGTNLASLGIKVGFLKYANVINH